MEQRYFAVWIELQCGLEQVLALARIVHPHVDEPIVIDDEVKHQVCMLAVSAAPKRLVGA